ncbi:MAG: imidazole glycerol phosphate synthase subunit HisH [Bacillota bacterium]
MVVVIDYKLGNITSVLNGFKRAGVDVTLSNTPSVIKQADVLILPGVGAFKDAMDDLIDSGLDVLIKNHVNQGKLLIGICLGMQLLFETGFEFGKTSGFGFLKGTVRKIDTHYKIPHMGWNDLTITKNDSIVTNINNGDYVYFIHSFKAEAFQEDIIATTTYGEMIPAIVRKNNVIGMQFHPEKSGLIGLKLLTNIKEEIA